MKRKTLRERAERCAEDAKTNEYKLVLTHCDQQEAECFADALSHGPTRDHVDYPKMKLTAKKS